MKSEVYKQDLEVYKSEVYKQDLEVYESESRELWELSRNWNSIR